MHQQSSHNSLCIGVSSWLSAGFEPTSSHDEKPMQRELCDDCWGIAAPDRQPAQLDMLDMQPPKSRLAGRAPTSTSRQQSARTSLVRHFRGRFWFCSCCFCSLKSVSAMIAGEFQTYWQL